VRDRARWALVLLPVVVGGGLWLAARAGAMADPRVRLVVSALRGDWLLAVGTLLSLLGLAAAGIALRRDARWRQRLADQEEAAARDRRRLLARLDHELKNPLTAMRAAVANASGGLAESDRQRGLRSLQEQVLRLSRLTEALRALADVESGTVARRPVDVAVLLEEAVDIARDQPEAGRLRITLDLPHAPWPLPAVPGDWELLSLAVRNLLDNAVKYTPPGGRVEVRAREASGDVLIEVADTGVGIGPVDLPHVWEELYRGNRARAVQGSGLGLALVRAVLARHGGSVALESREGQGTVVRVRLPGGPAPGAPAPDLPEAAELPAPAQKAADPAT
jgi:signal transduction histidine kinase